MKVLTIKAIDGSGYRQEIVFSTIAEYRTAINYPRLAATIYIF